MKAAGYLETGTDFVPQNYAEIAHAMGIEAIHVEDPADLEDAVRATFQHQGPALLDVVVNRQELSLPPKITFEQAHGFTLWMLKAVLNGHGNDLIDVAKTNLFR